MATEDFKPEDWENLSEDQILRLPNDEFIALVESLDEEPKTMPRLAYLLRTSHVGGWSSPRIKYLEP